MGEIVLLALGSALWPSIGVAIVLLLSGASLVDRSRPPPDPVLDFVVAGLMFLVAYARARSQVRLKAASLPKPVAKPGSRSVILIAAV
jgi:hypothetical protein